LVLRERVRRVTTSAPKSTLIRYAIVLAAVAFGVRVLVSTIYVAAYDTYENTPSMTDRPGAQTHSMIKGDALKYYVLGAEIAEQIRAGENPFLAGGWHALGALYQRVVGGYAVVTGKITFAPNGSVAEGQILGFLVLQSLIFSLCLAPFFIQLARVTGIPLAGGAAGLLALEPTLVQYSAMMLTEELFVAFVLLALAVFLEIYQREGSSVRERWPWLVLLGLVLGVMFLQRPQAILLPGAFLAGTLALFGWKLSSDFFRAAGFLLAPYVIVLLLFGLHNYGRAGFFYIVPLQTPMAWQKYLGNRVIAEVNGTDPADERARLMALALQRAKSEGFVEEDVYDVDDGTEYGMFRVHKIAQRQALEIFADHPLITARIMAAETAGSLVLHLTYPYRWYSETYKPVSAEEGRLRELRRLRSKPPTIVYSLLIMLPAAFGWIFMRGAIPPPVNWVLVLFIVYFPATGGWLANPRYTLPNVVPYAVYWSLFVVSMRNRLVRSSPSDNSA